MFSRWITNLVISLGVGLKEINRKLKTRYAVLMFGVSCCWQGNIPIAGVITGSKEMQKRHKRCYLVPGDASTSSPFAEK